MDSVTIVTVYNACNYGSFLQAYALKNAIERNNYKVNFLKMDVDVDKVIGTDLFSDQYIEFENDKYNKIVSEQKAFDVIEKDNLNSIACVIGSDTVWNMFDPAYANVPYFVGKGIPCRNIFSYAASLGQNNYYKILLTKLIKLLPIRRLSSHGVRDDKTERFVKLLGRKPTRVVDPTFLIDFNDEKPEMFFEEDFILVYTYGFSDEEIASVKQFAQEKKLKIVATGSLCQWADYNMSVGSFEWLWLVKNASYVVTNTFHGTVFSIKYNKKFVSFGLLSDKVISLLAEFGLSSRNIHNDRLSTTIDDEIDYSMVNELIEKKRNESLDFLYRSILGEYK